MVHKWATYRRTPAVAVFAEILGMCLAAAAYGTLGALVQTVLEVAQRPNAADHWVTGWIALGVLMLVGWGRQADRRWGGDPR